MSQKRILVLALVAVAFTMIGNNFAQAGGECNLKEIELTGTVTAETKTKEKKDGETHTYTVYHLTSGDQQIYLPEACRKCGQKKDEPLAYVLADFVGQRVAIVAKGHVKEGKDGKTYTKVHSIASIAAVSGDEA